jgi:hypothetical protein
MSVRQHGRHTICYYIVANLGSMQMTKTAKELFEFREPPEFIKGYPKKARLLDDKVLSKYVSWILVDRSESEAGKTFLLMSASAYRKACNYYAPATDDFLKEARDEAERPLREQSAEVSKCRATIASLRKELKELQGRQPLIDQYKNIVGQELEAVRIVKRELQSLIERLKLGDSDTPAEMRGFFARVEEFALNKFTKEAWKTPHRHAKSPDVLK